MHPWPSCNGRTRNAVSMSIWVYTRPHYFYCPSHDFTNSIVSVGNKQSLCSLTWGTREKWGGTSTNFRLALRTGTVPPTCKLLPTPLTPLFDASTPSLMYLSQLLCMSICSFLIVRYLSRMWTFFKKYSKTFTDLLSGPMSGSWPFPLRNAALCE